MKKHIHPFLVAAFLLSTALISSSCRKAGTGGDAEAHFKVMHHSEHIPAATVYLKFNADEFPGPDASNYDLSTTADQSGHGVFKDLKRGKYYIYATGFDSSLNENVSGGVSFKVIKKDEMLELTIPVTEGH